MANVLVEEQALKDIAGAIRTKKGAPETEKYKPAVMANEITNLPSGGAADYASLPDKPSINGVVLEGNKTSEELGISGGGGGGAQSDWNAAASEPGHILNKPFYDEIVTQPSRTITGLKVPKPGTLLTYPEKLNLVLGATYSVQIIGIQADGTRHEYPLLSGLTTQPATALSPDCPGVLLMDADQSIMIIDGMEAIGGSPDGGSGGLPPAFTEANAASIMIFTEDPEFEITIDGGEAAPFTFRDKKGLNKNNLSTDVQSDWNVTDDKDATFIKNKPFGLVHDSNKVLIKTIPNASFVKVEKEEDPNYTTMTVYRYVSDVSVKSLDYDLFGFELVLEGSGNSEIVTHQPPRKLVFSSYDDHETYQAGNQYLIDSSKENNKWGTGFKDDYYLPSRRQTTTFAFSYPDVSPELPGTMEFTINIYGQGKDIEKQIETKYLSNSPKHLQVTYALMQNCLPHGVPKTIAISPAGTQIHPMTMDIKALPEDPTKAQFTMSIAQRVYEGYEERGTLEGFSFFDLLPNMPDPNTTLARMQLQMTPSVTKEIGCSGGSRVTPGQTQEQRKLFASVFPGCKNISFTLGYTIEPLDTYERLYPETSFSQTFTRSLARCNFITTFEFDTKEHADSHIASFKQDLPTYCTNYTNTDIYFIPESSYAIYETPSTIN